MRYRNHRAYSEALDRAALMVLAALGDHIRPQFSSVQLEILRRRRDDDRAQGFDNHALHVVFADIRERCASILAAELREARVADNVAAEMTRALDRLLDSAEQIFATRQPQSMKDIRFFPNLPGRLIKAR
jgi:hypothetical protein